MKNKKLKRWIITLLIVLVVLFIGRFFARLHVNAKTAVDNHPLNCASCHLYEVKEGFIYNMLNEIYISPLNTAISKDGNKLYIVAQEANALIETEVATHKVLMQVTVGERPHSVVLDKKGEKAYVSNQWADYVSVINLSDYRITDSLKTGNGPAEMAITSDNSYLYVVNSFSSDISIIDLRTNKEIKRLTAGNNPVGAKISPDGNFLYVTSRRTLPAPYGSKLKTELTVTDTRNQRVADRRIFESAYIMENVDFTPGGDLAIATLVRPKNLIPSIQVEGGWMMNHGIGIIEQKEDGRVIQLLLDEPDAYYSDPYDIAITPDGKKAFVSHAGVNIVSVIDIDSIRSLINASSPEMLKKYANYLGISSQYIIKRITTGSNPKGLTASPDGKWIYVAERLEDRIAVINTESLEVEDHIYLQGPERITVSRHGRRLFNNAGRTFQNQYSCYTCHPDAHEDGLVYNMAGVGMGRNLTNVQTLRDIGDTPPFKWNGKNQTIHKQDGMRFSTFLTRTESFSPEDLNAIVCYIRTGIKDPPNLQYNPNGELMEAQIRGKKVFERTHDNFGNEIPEGNRCITCHPPPYYTNLQLADVGTLAETDDSIMFDTPQLNNLHLSSPYLHDGRAATLEEIWTKFNNYDQHGVGNDMTKSELNDLVEYLKSIRPARLQDHIHKKNKDTESKTTYSAKL